MPSLAVSDGADGAAGTWPPRFNRTDVGTLIDEEAAVRVGRMVGEGEVLVELRSAGLCHSDLPQVAGLRKRTLPVVMGHEGARIVCAGGRGVKAFKPGDQVVVTVR